MKRLVLCIDDYALRAGVDAAVLDLAARGLATATSCLVGLPRWRTAASALRQVDTLDAGLHLDLTEAPFDRSLRTPLGALVARSSLGALPRERLRAEIRAQFNAFEDAMGRAPDHVDGHQHVHQLPLVRDGVLDELQRRGHGHTWLRGTAAADGGIKPRVIAALGGAALRRAAGARGFAVSGRLLGVYGFDADARRYRELLDGWLRRARDGDVLMCHPGHGDREAAGDPIAAARETEARVLANELAALLAANGCELVRLSATGATGSARGAAAAA